MEALKFKLSFPKQEREGGATPQDAALRGADLRYRAVMMTAWSFIIGVLPLVFARGAGAAGVRAGGAAQSVRADRGCGGCDLP